MSNTNNAEPPVLVQAKVEEHTQLVPVYVKKPEESLIDSALVKWTSKILMAIMSMIVVPIGLTVGYHAYSKLEKHGEDLAVVISNQADNKRAMADLTTKFDQVVGQVNENKNSIVALNQEFTDMKAAPAPAPVIERVPEPVWHQPRRAPDPTPPFVRALEKAFDPHHRR